MTAIEISNIYKNDNKTIDFSIDFTTIESKLSINCTYDKITDLFKFDKESHGSKFNSIASNLERVKHGTIFEFDTNDGIISIFYTDVVTIDFSSKTNILYFSFKYNNFDYVLDRIISILASVQIM